MKYVSLFCLLFIFSVSVNGQTTNIDIGTGLSSTDNSPIQRGSSYSASELLYLSSEINNAGLITGLGFNKASGSTAVTIDSVYIYLKTTVATSLTTASGTAGYTLVYKGAFPNNLSSGWMTVNFNMVNGFNYNTGLGNLAVLIVRPFQASTTFRPFYRYSTNTGSKNAWYKSNIAGWSGTMGEVSSWRPNIRLAFSTGCAAPTSPTATGITTTSALLNWNQTGTSVNYQIKYGAPGFNVNTGGTSVFTPTKPYTLNPPLAPSTSYSYYVRTICSAGDTSAWSVVADFTTSCASPPIVSKKDSFNCGTGTVTLQATTTAGSGLQWYTAATGGASVGTGNIFVTPAISTTTNYYVEAVGFSPAGQIGRNDYTGIAQVTPNNTGQGIRFNALTDINLDSVAVWVTNDTGRIVTQLQNAANTVLRTDTFTFAGTGATSTQRKKIYLKVDYSISTGNNYKILAMPGTTVPLSREQIINPTFSNYSIANVITMVSAWVNGATNAANYYYFYNMHVSAGCSSPRQAVVATIRPIPVVSLGNDTILCPGASYTLDAGNAGGAYLWSPGGQTTQAITANGVGTYSVNVTVNGCSKKDTIVITPGAVPVNNLQDTVNLCEGNVTALDAGNPGSTYNWTPGSATTQAINVNSGGNYAVDITNIHGCKINSNTYVEMRPLPVDDLGNDTAICNAAVIVLDAGNAGGSYAWNTGATTQTINATDSGTYTVVVTTSYNCVNSDTMHIAFIEEPRAEGFNFIPKFFEELGKVEFSPLNPTSVTGYEWDFGDGSPLVTAMNPIHVYSASGQYTVTLKVHNECTDFSRSQTINVDLPTGVASLAKDNFSLNIYPNPAMSVLNINNGNIDYEMQDIMIFNAIGAMVYHRKADSKTMHRLSVEGFSSGAYFVRVLTDKGFVNRQVQVVK